MNEHNQELWQQINATDRANQQKLASTGWWHSIELGNGLVTPGVRSLAELRELYASFGLPQDLRGKRLLDIGCWDGFFSFEAERHGAEVVAIDYWQRANFFEARAALQSSVEFHEMSVYELDRDRFGTFDIVLMLGVLYHLQHPLLALQKVCELTRDVALIESHVVDSLIEDQRPLMQFYELDELGGQQDNWWGPNIRCLTGMTRAAGFLRSEVIMHANDRAAIKAYRRETLLPEPTPTIDIVGVVNSFNFQPRHPRRGRHAYLTVLANHLPAEAARENVKITVDGFGVFPVYVGPPGDPTALNCEFQLNAALPPGLSLGRAAVQVFCLGRSSAPVEIEIVEGGEW